MYDLGAPVAFRLCLFGDRTHHIFRELDGPDLDVADFNPPGLRLRVQDALHVGTQLLAFR
jgi:hypothetical protein